MQYIFRLIRFLTLNYKPFRKKNELLTVLFHQVNDNPFTFYPAVPTKVYQETCLFLAKRYEIIHFSEIEQYYQSNPTKPAAIITFDDGMYDIVEHVLPFMEKHQLKFNINIDTEILETKLPQDFLRVYDILNSTKKISSYLDAVFTEKPIKINYDLPIETENEFTKILSNLPKEEKRKFTEVMHHNLDMKTENYSRVISTEELTELADNKLIEIGSHSHTHAVMTQIKSNDIHFELTHSKKQLEKILKKKIEVIAYPNGASNTQIDQMAIENGYRYLLKTEDKPTVIKDSFNFKSGSYYRINQYHQNTELLLAHTFGIIGKIKSVIKR
ncbi:MAG: polysaccharide deacetylase family protein [Crocinitomicaceae bacterium]